MEKLNSVCRCQTDSLEGIDIFLFTLPIKEQGSSTHKGAVLRAGRSFGLCDHLLHGLCQNSQGVLIQETKLY